MEDMAIKEKTNKHNLVDKLKHMEGFLDIMEEDLETNVNHYHLGENVYSIFPDVNQQWKLCQVDEEMTLFEMVDMCERWVEDLTVSMIHNQGKFNNKKLSKHIGEIIQVCRTIIAATYHWLDKINNQEPTT
jgi:hypothetical protein